MIVSPETYYEYEIKGKTQEQILYLIVKLKRNMAQLKRNLEYPYYGVINTDALTQLSFIRKYIDRAKETLTLDQPITVRGQITSVGEIFGYSLDLIEILK